MFFITQKIYSWVKYKILPPSYTCKNRLYFERSSQEKRIFSNFGLTFRNSKWTDYTRVNILLETYYSFKRFLLNSIKFFIITYFLVEFFNLFFYTDQNSPLTYLYWSLFDFYFYYLILLLWAILKVIGFVISKTYNLFVTVEKKVDPFSELSPMSQLACVLYNSPRIDNHILAKCTQLETMYSWTINLSKKNRRILNYFYEGCFQFRNLDCLKNFPTFLKLFQVNSLLSLKTQKNNYYENYLNLFKEYHLTSALNFFKLSTTPIVKDWYFFIDLATKPSYNEAKFWYKPNLKTLNERFKWNLKNLNLELENTDYSYLINDKTLNGVFYLSQTSSSNVYRNILNFKELNYLWVNLQDQLRTINYLKWTYKYNILHSKILKNSHKLTQVKKLSNVGFYDNSLTANNLWASNELTKINLLNFINESSNLLYKNQTLNSLNNELPLIKTNGGLDSLAFNETSFFWFIKRFYLLNNLNTNKITSNLVLEVFNPNKLQTNPLLTLNLNSFLKTSKYLNLNPFSLKKNRYRVSKVGTNLVQTSYNKDLTYNYKEIDNLISENVKGILNLANINVFRTNNLKTFIFSKKK